MARRAPLCFAAALAIILSPSGGSALAQPAGRDGPAFSCANPDKLEAAICASADLAARDRTMAALYAAARTGALGNGRSGELAAQRQWLKQRDADCGATADHDCLARDYDARLTALAAAALFTAPEAALAELRRQDAPSAAAYEAIWRYATLDDPAARARSVAPLIGPLLTAEAQSPGMPPDAKTADAAVASDEALAQVLDLAPLQLDKGVTMPCAAIAKRPGLIAALKPLFGSSMDAQLLSSDCEETLPPLPRFTALASVAVDASPVCDGTIRFMYGRTLDEAMVAIRLNRPDVWRGGLKDFGSPATGEARFRKAHATEITSASAELAASYVADFGLQVDAAKKTADEAVSDLVRDSFRLCD